MRFSTRQICIAILVVLPFSKSMTLPVLFPLKMYELLVPLGLLASFAEGRIDVGTQSKFFRAWMLFWLMSLFSTSWGLHVLAEPDLGSLSWARGRYLPQINATLHTGYLSFDIAALVLFQSALTTGKLKLQELTRWWTVGALVGVAYAGLLNVVHFLGLSTALVGRPSKIFTLQLPGFDLVRNGPFEEGNYFGLYLVLSLAIALWSIGRYGDKLSRRAILVLVAGILSTASPAALALGGVVLATGVATGRVSGALRLWLSGILVVVIAIVGTTSLFEELVLNKFSLLLYGGITDSKNVSLVQRMNEAHHAWRMFLDQPLGVGIGNFGYFWGRHPELYAWLRVDYAGIKQIPNMIYMEVLSEHGIQGLAIFLFCMGTLWQGLTRSGERLLRVSLLCMLAYFLVFPTYRLAFLWLFWAFLLQVIAESRTREHA